MTVNELVSSAVVLYMQGGREQELEYVSRSECSQLGWYFWLKNVPGVYEMEMKGYDPEMNSQGASREDFYIRYYPALDEDVLESYSVLEQLARFDKNVFDDSEITTDMEEHEICPCCAVPQKHGNHGHEHGSGCHCGHEHGHQILKRRPKGIPGILKKFDMNKKLFMIGDLTVSINEKATSFTASLKTSKSIIERAQEAITIQQAGETTVLVEKGGIDRHVPGYELSARFMEFFCGRVLETVAKGKPAAVCVKGGQVAASGSCPNADETADITIQYIFSKGG